MLNMSRIGGNPYASRSRGPEAGHLCDASGLPTSKHRFLLSRLCFSAFVALIALAPLHACAGLPDEAIRVGLVRFYNRVARVQLSSSAGLTLTDSTGKQLLSCPVDAPVALSAEGGAVTIKSGLDVSSGAGPYVTAVPSDPTSTIRIECPGKPARDYRGRLEIWPKSGTMQLVNVLGVEDYLLGCVPEEMPSSYPVEAIKAQAIAARTFTLRNTSKHSADGYGVCDASNCQNYGGVSSEKAKASEAIKATAGVTIVYQGQLASVMYGADCGGVTQDYAETRSNGGLPYLCSVTEPAEMPHCSWEVDLTLQTLGAKLVAAGVEEAEGLRSVKVSRSGTSGRAIDLEIEGASGTTTISAERLRTILGLNVLRSRLFTIEAAADGSLVFKGKGAGHGVGLCQVGARWLAMPPRGYTCEQILAHYYPGTELAKIGGVSLASPVQTKVPPRVAQQTTSRKAPVSPAPVSQPKPPRKHGSGVTFDVRLKAPDRL